jgi:hypothetical protein
MAGFNRRAQSTEKVRGDRSMKKNPAAKQAKGALRADPGRIHEFGVPTNTTPWLTTSTNT